MRDLRRKVVKKSAAKEKRNLLNVGLKVAPLSVGFRDVGFSVGWEVGLRVGLAVVGLSVDVSQSRDISM